MPDALAISEDDVSIEADPPGTAATEDFELEDCTIEASTDGGAKPANPLRPALLVGTLMIVALAALTAWLGYRAYQSKETAQLQDLLVGVGRQGAINLTTIDAAEADKDVQRILDSAIDTFYDDFAKRSQPFIEVVKQAQSKSVGEVTEAGLESISGNEGQVLVAVTVTTSNRGAPNQPKRSWRMRLTVKKSGEDEAKVSKVEFVP
ncbi:Mce protein [Mycolicibacterium sp. lyk4-40-TYG-92]|uniref:Mce protein n=1 Tax=Mycolicibacterium sp. lyk4-40-TYG-92 TaxID=3040295 RepID=UPI00254E05DB|nr:Mce protein [Mycolicibacterium sp. lyk4-40-TYG-92]